MDRVVSSSLQRQKHSRAGFSQVFCLRLFKECRESGSRGCRYFVVGSWQNAGFGTMRLRSAAGRRTRCRNGKAQAFGLRERFGERLRLFPGVLLLIPWGGMNESRPGIIVDAAFQCG